MDYRVPRSAVDGLEGDDFLWAVIEPTWPDSSVHDELHHIAAATPGQRAIYTVTIFMRELDNGGLEQFYFNSSGIYAQAVLEGLRLLGADGDADIFQRSFAVFPNGQVPEDWRDRRAALSAIGRDELRHHFVPLEDQLYGEERLTPYFHAYIEKHPEEFFLESA